jgi:hypothetical protein
MLVEEVLNDSTHWLNSTKPCFRILKYIEQQRQNYNLIFDRSSFEIR